MPFLAFDLDAKKRVPAAARAAGVEPGVVAWGLLEVWEHVWSTKSDVVSDIVFEGCFGPSPRMRTVMTAYGFVEPVDEGVRVKGADRYLRVRQARSNGGHAAKENLIPGGQRKANEPSPEELPLGSFSAAAEKVARLELGSTPNTEHRTPKEEKEETLSADADPRAADPSELQTLWNDVAHPSLPRWKDMTDKRRPKAIARLEERSLEDWANVIQRISASAFCRGERSSGWRANPDWLLQPDTATKVLEGKYDDPATTPGVREKPRNPELTVGRGVERAGPCAVCGEPGANAGAVGCLCPSHSNEYFAASFAPGAFDAAAWLASKREEAA